MVHSFPYYRFPPNFTVSHSFPATFLSSYSESLSLYPSPSCYISVNHPVPSTRSSMSSILPLPFLTLIFVPSAPRLPLGYSSKSRHIFDWWKDVVGPDILCGVEGIQRIYLDMVLFSLSVFLCIFSIPIPLPCFSVVLPVGLLLPLSLPFCFMTSALALSHRPRSDLCFSREGIYHWSFTKITTATAPYRLIPV
ncbi:hypothetical protein BD779DRAFT_115658 [Infundibulicybe gibba]|nr:hypothetical protein BD779DRAFT_115658 [Infundibulicybe gibba]